MHDLSPPTSPGGVGVGSGSWVRRAGTRSTTTPVSVPVLVGLRQDDPEGPPSVWAGSVTVGSHPS